MNNFLSSTQVAGSIFYDDTIISPQASVSTTQEMLDYLKNAQSVGLTNSTLFSSTTFSTTSTTYVAITGFSVTPQSGTYAVLVNMDISQSTNNSISFSTIFKGATNQAQSERSTQAAGGTWSGFISINSIVSFNGSEECSVRVNISTGSLTIKNRTLILMRLGS